MNMWMTNMVRNYRILRFVLLALLFHACGILSADPTQATITSPANSITVALGQTVGFSATSTDGAKINYSATSYSWSCSDGWTSYDENTSHGFPIAGTYTVTLTVAYSYQICKIMDYDGNCLTYQTRTGTATASRVITVTPASISGISPSNPTVNAGSSVQFSASVSGAVNAGVNWSVTGGGSINTNGLFTATTAGVYTVVATAAADSSKSSSTSVTVNSVVTGVSVTPSSISLKAGEATSFTAQVTGLGGPSTAVTWSATGGSVASNGAYTAPTFGGAYTVTARSSQDTAKYGSATVYVSAIAVGAPAPANTSVNAGSSIQYSASVSGAVNAGISWSVSGGGSISSSGLFTSSAPGTYTVTATSQADGITSNSTSVNVNGLGVSLDGSKTIAYGGSTTLTPYFVAGSGVLNPGNRSVTSGTPVSVGPLTSTTSYTLTVTNGAYTAPPIGATVSVSSVSVSGLAPTNTSVNVGSQLQFSAVVNNDALNRGLTWSVSGGGGAIDATGLFTATTIGGPYTVTATSLADGTKSSSTGVTVNGLGISLAESKTIPYGGTTTLTPYFAVGTGVLNPGNRTVTSGTPVSVGPLTVTTPYTLTVTNGTYNAPAVGATVTVTPVTVSSVFPANATVSVGSQLQYTASVNGAQNQVIKWSVSGDVGTIDLYTGLFTAMAAGGPFTVTATSDANNLVFSTTGVTVGGLGVTLDSSKTIPYGGTTTLTPHFAAGSGVLDPGNQLVTSGTPVTVGPLTSTTDYLLTVTNGGYRISASAKVTVSQVVVATPTSTSSYVNAGSTLQFVSSVSGASDSRITWSVNGDGSIDSTGLFTAGTAGNYTVTATSVADTSKSASTPVTVNAVVSNVIVTPTSITLNPGAVYQFSASVVGLGITNHGVTWTATGGANISSNGNFTAPAQSGDITIQATSQQDSSKYGTATVRVRGWVTRWKRDIVYIGAKEIAEVDAQGVHTTLVDHLGSPRFVVNGSGVIESEQKFLPFGEALADSTTMAKFAKGFTNHEQTDPSGLIYMQARFYAPWYGRFLSPDPARDQHFEETQSWNIYSYVQNNPTMSIDPTGMFDWNLKTRGLGALKMLGGAAQVGLAYTAGMVSAMSGKGAPVVPILAAGVAAKGGDNFQAGAQQLLSGNHVDNASTQGIAGTTGMSVEKARMVDGAVDFAATVSLGAAQFKISANLDVVTGNGGASVSSQASSFAPAEGETRVTRWMSGTEATAMKDSGNLQFGAGGRTYVTELGAPQPGGTGPVQVNFNVPTSSLQQAGKQGWYQILDTKRPPVTGIEVVK